MYVLYKAAISKLLTLKEMENMKNQFFFVYA